MANTKDTLLIVAASGDMSAAKNAAGRTISAAEVTLYGLGGSEADAAALATASGYTLDAFAAATAAEFEVDTTGVTAGEEHHAQQWIRAASDVEEVPKHHRGQRE